MGITIYSTPSCQQCRMTYRTLDAAGVTYDIVDVAENEQARAYVTGDLGYSTAPVVVIDDEDHWSGFRPDQLARIIKRAILPSDATREARSPAR